MPEAPQPETPGQHNLETADPTRNLRAIARRVIQLTHQKRLPLIRKLGDSRVFSWPHTRTVQSLTEGLAQAKENIEESERLKRLARRVGIISTEAALAGKAVLERTPFQFDIIRDSDTKGISVSFRGEHYRLSLSHENSFSEAEEFVVDPPGLPSRAAEITELEKALAQLAESAAEDLPAVRPSDEPATP